jgi:hypothetical protein
VGLLLSWSLRLSYLPIQPFFQPHAVWYVSYQSLSCYWHINLDYGTYRLSNLEMLPTAGVTGQQGMLTPPWQLILPLPGVHPNLIFTVDYSITWTGNWFWLRIFLFTWLSVLILTADCTVYLIWTHWFWLLLFTFDMGCTAGAIDRQGMFTLLWYFIPPLIFSEVRVRPFSNLCFLYDLWDWYTVRYFCHFIRKTGACVSNQLGDKHNINRRKWHVTIKKRNADDCKVKIITFVIYRICQSAIEVNNK